MKRLFITLLYVVSVAVASAATVTLHNSATFQVEFNFNVYENSDWTGGQETIYVSLEGGESQTIDIPSWYGSAEFIEYSSDLSLRFVEGDDSFSYWWTGSGFSLTPPVEEPQLPPGVLSLQTQIALFFAGAGFIAPLMAVMMVIRFARKAARSDVS